MEKGSSFYTIGNIVLVCAIPILLFFSQVSVGALMLRRGELGFGPNSGRSGTTGGCLGAVVGESGMSIKEGHTLPASTGKVGREQHLAIKKATDSPTDFVNSKTNGDDPIAQVHYSLSNTPTGDQNGMAGRFGARGKPSTVDEERYYINMRWDYSQTGGRGFWFEPPQTILVTNPSNGKQVRAAVIEYGPAEWTGRVAGLSPEAMTALGANTDDVLSYVFANPCESTGSDGTGVMIGGGITPKPIPGIPELVVDESHRLKYKDRGTISPSMIVLHWTGGDSFGGALSALETRMPEVGGLSVQIMIDKDGTAYQIMDSLDGQSAGAAGANDWAINIEIVGSGPSDLGNGKIINKTVAVVKSLASKYSIKHVIATESQTPAENMLASLQSHQGVFSHQIVDKFINEDPTGKIDPGDKFMKNIQSKLKW